MTTKERVTRMFEHKEADRVPMVDTPWPTTLERWIAQGLPANMPWEKYFDLDLFAGMEGDITPQYPQLLVEETPEYTITKSNWGVTFRNWKHIASTPEFMDFTLKGPDNWQEFKARMTPSRDRIPWAYLEQHYKEWRKEGRFIYGYINFGFDVTHSWVVGTEPFLMAIALYPEWCKEVFEFFLDCSLAHLQMIWDAGYHFDAIKWCDDMGYKTGTFFSIKTYRDLLKPAQKRAIDWAHQKGVFAHLHSCGNIKAFVPDLIELGLDCLNPLEVKAGMDPYMLKKEYGDKLCLHGGFNAMLWQDVDKLEAEMRKLLPAMKVNGGYLFASDHSIPDDVSLGNMKRVVELYKELSKY